MADRFDPLGELTNNLRPDITLRTQPPSPAAKASYASRVYVPRKNVGGNFCEHSPVYPALEIPTLLPDKFPPILKKLCERISRYYYDPVEWLPSVDAANGSERRQRSERREAIVLLLTAIVRRIELTSMRCGTPTRLGFRPISMKALATLAGISLQRASRALRDLRRGGIVSCYQKRFLNDEGHYRAYYAIRKVDRAIFGLFDIRSREVDAAMKYAARKLKEKASKWSEQTCRHISVRDVLKVNVMLRGTSAGSKYCDRPWTHNKQSGCDPP